MRLFASSSPGSPPAIWSAFARQAAWKDWVIVLLIGLEALTVLAAVRVARKDPDIVVVAADGKSTYMTRAVAGDALVRFLAEQRQQPSDVTVVHFTGDFLQLLLAINSATVEGAWRDALALMGPELRQRYQDEATRRKLLDTYKLAKMQTTLTTDAIDLVDRNSSMLHVKAALTRKSGSLLISDAATSQDRLSVELVERLVPRTLQHPDGLEVVEIRITPLAAATAAPETRR
jgi:hypothetical protein